MRHFVVAGLVLMLSAPFSNAQSSQQSKKPKPSAILAFAKYVFIEPCPGSVCDPGASPGDRESVANGHVPPESLETLTNVQNAIQKWGYYTVTIRRDDADLILYVRKGRVVTSHVGVHGGNDPADKDPSRTRQPQGGVNSGVAANLNEDMIWVYSLTPEKRLFGPIWHKELKDGLDAPDMVLFENFKNDVIAAAAQQAKKQTPTKQSTP